MHGARSGAPKGNRNAVKHGLPEVLSALASMFVARHIRLANAVAKKR
jgi:hypothetical protein